MKLVLYLFSSKGALERIQLVLAHPSRQGREKAKKLGRKPSDVRQQNRNHSHFTASRSAFSLQVPVLTPLNSPIVVALGPHKEEKTGQEPRAQEKISPQMDPFGDPSPGNSAHRAGQTRLTPTGLRG